MTMLFCNAAWMKRYRGKKGDAPTGGGSFVDENGTGSEIQNFNDKDGIIRGYVQVRGTINIERLGAAKGSKSLDGVTVVWTAPSPLGGSVIVGWYKHATVLKKMKMDYRFYDRGYNISAEPKNVYLLPVDKRIRIIPRGRNGIGQANIWYADNKSQKFLDEINNYIKAKGNVIKKERKVKKSGAVSWNSDPLKRQGIERKAIQIVSKHFNSLGYAVKSFEKDNLGWDLQAHLSDSKYLRLEVKGLSGSKVAIELTPNEFKNMEKHKSSYRICVVTNALKKPKIWIFSYSPDNNGWEDENNNILHVQKVISARMQLA